MEIHEIGHASMVVRTTNLTILMDPVLWDPHQEGLFDVHPKREVIHDKLPNCNVMIISHRHLDHFDIRSLASLPKDLLVLIPQDPLLEKYLKVLGYKRVRTLADFSEVKIGATRIMTTRSENRVPEFGIVFADESGVVWNQVDTVVVPKTVEKVRARYFDIDLVIAAWQPMLEDNFQMNRSLGFPHERYRQVLYNIGLTEPRALVPGANAFCYTGGAAWLNQIVFPVTRERFLVDVQTAVPGLTGAVFPADPGDLLRVQNGACELVVNGCEFVKRNDGDRRMLDFSPVTVSGVMVDENGDEGDPLRVEEAVTSAVERGLAALLLEQARSFVEHHKWGIVYQLEVVLPNRRLQWHVDFSKPSWKPVRGANPLANMVTYITGSALHGLITRTRGWDYAILGGYYRNFQMVCGVSEWGTLYPGAFNEGDPLHLLFPYNEILTHILDHEVVTWAPQEIAVPV